MFSARLEKLDSKTTRFHLRSGTRAISRREAVACLADDERFQMFVTDTLAALDMEAFFWETPPFSFGSWDRAFEFVVIDAPELRGAPADPRSFQEWFDSRAAEGVAVFPNLGGDAILVAPAPVPGEEGYAHLAKFVRGGPRFQTTAFWRRAGEALASRVAENRCG